MTNSTTFFVIYSNTSRNSMYGLRPQVTWAFGKGIVDFAALEMNLSGESLEDLAGIEWIEDADGNMTPARDLAYGEVLALSIEKLGDDGRMYATFTTDALGAAAFIEAAEDNGMSEEAHAIVEKFNS